MRSLVGQWKDREPVNKLNIVQPRPRCFRENSLPTFPLRTIELDSTIRVKGGQTNNSIGEDE